MRTRALVLALAALLAAPSVVAGAQTAPTTPSPTTPTTAPEQRRVREIEDRIRALKDAIDEVSAEEARLLSDLSDTQARLDGFDATIARIDGELAAATGRLQAAQAEVDRLEGRFLALTRQLRETTRGIDDAEDDVADIAAELYRRAGGGQAGAFTTLALDAETPQDLFAGTQYLTTAASADRKLVEDLSALKRRVEYVRAGLEDERDAARAARDVVVSERGHIVGLRDEQERARHQVEREVDRQEGLLAEIDRRKGEFTAEINALKAESNSIAALLRARQTGQQFTGGSGIFIRPVAAPITSGFGPRVHPILRTARMHNGIDFGAMSGTPVMAAGAGEIVWAGPRGGYGNTVIIDHGNTLATLYAHLSSVSVRVGQTVGQGQVVGAVGSTGLSTGPHLHFEVRRSGTPVDPMGYL